MIGHFNLHSMMNNSDMRSRLEKCKMSGAVDYLPDYKDVCSYSFLLSLLIEVILITKQ